MGYDVIVVGAGPAGAVSAYQLARHGLRVLILEKEALPRYKTCGGGVTLKAVNSIPFDVRPILELQAVGSILCHAGQELRKVELSTPVGWMVMRDRFDGYLVEQAVAAGAELIDAIEVKQIEQDGQGVQARTSRGTFTSLLLAGADGVNSRVAKSVGLLSNRQTGVAIEAELEVSVSALEAQGKFATFDFGALPGGYAWIFPKQDHLSVGVFQANPARASHLKESLAKFIEGQQVLRDQRALSQRGHRIPLGGMPGRLHAGRVLLVGDAANLADPWVGEGIYYAIASGREAAAVMIAFLDGKSEDLSGYTRTIQRRFMPEFREAQRYARFVYRFPGFCSLALQRSPYVLESIFGLLRGEFGFKRLTRRLVGGIPRIFSDMLSGKAVR